MMGGAYAAVKVVELDQEPALAANRARALNILTGLRTVPNTFIAGKNVGASTMLTKARDSGELRVLLREAGVLPIHPGERIPSAVVRVVKQDAMGGEEQDTESLFKSKTAVLFGVPAAFSPSCSERHLPGASPRTRARKASAASVRTGNLSAAA